MNSNSAIDTGPVLASIRADGESVPNRKPVKPPILSNHPPSTAGLPSAIGLALLLAVAAPAGDRNFRVLDLHDQAVQESLIPLRPGMPGQRPFWNEAHVPICRSMGMMLAAYQKAHQVTGKRSYLEKARAIASALTVGQKVAMEKVDGQFPTLFSTQGEGGYPAKWITNAVYPAKYLAEFSRYLSSLGPADLRGPAPRSNAAAPTKGAVSPGADPKLPNVLIIGDSISIGYTAPVTRMLAGKANVRRIPGNGRSTAFGLQHLQNWLGQQKWDVIHFNWGIWDMHRLENDQPRTTPAQYEKNLRDLVSRLKATGAKLIWATTTPLGPRPEGARNVPVNSQDVPAYNAAALKIMRENGVAIDDLYSAVLPKTPALWGPDRRHFKSEGSEFLAARVVASIQPAL